MRNAIHRARETLQTWGPDLVKHIVCCVLWLALLLIIAVQFHMFFSIMVALFTATVVYLLNVLRNLHLESKLRDAFQTVSQSQISVQEVPDVRCDFQILVRNTTSVRVNVREVRLRFSEANPLRSLLRLKYYGPSYHVINDDPDEMIGIFLPAGQERSGDKEREGFSLLSEPGEAHEIHPQCGALYGLSANTLRASGRSTLKQVLMIVDYPTVFGGRKVLRVEATSLALRNIQEVLEETLKHLEQAKARVKNPSKHPEL